jgi:outer membrane murein-binding lipoprotein Lpp
MGIFMIKKLLAIMVLVMVASLSVAGCTSNTNNTATSPSSTTASTHDALLEKLVNATQQYVYGNASNTVQAWQVTWNNDTSVTILETVKGNVSGTNLTVSSNGTIMSFPTTQDATNYLNAFDKTNYSLTSTNYTSDSGSHIYANVTGHVPSVYADYSYTEGSILSSLKVHELIQLDNIIQITTVTV